MGEKSIGLPKATEDEGHKRRLGDIVGKAKKETASKTTQTDQYREFVRAARDLGVDEGEETFDNALKRLAKAPPPKSSKKRRAKPK